MKIAPFHLERYQSIHEHEVEINLSESGVAPMTLHELLDATELEPLLSLPLAYSQTNGTPELRARVAGLHRGATPAHVEVTNGGSEANFVTCWALVEPGDEVVAMQPNYAQTMLLAESLGATVKPWRLGEPTDGGTWTVDLGALRDLVTAGTRLILVCNPNNPTGARLTGRELDGICAVAARHGAWVLVDEIYRGAELDGQETTSAFGRYERVIVTGGLSKAYGLPGLRIGWVVAPPQLVTRLWGHHDYTTIAPSAVGDHVARLVLDDDRRRQILDRTRRLLTANHAIVCEWCGRHADVLTHTPPEAGAIAFVRYRHDIGSTTLAERLRVEHGVLIVPGDHFGMDRYLRIGFGGPADEIRTGLARLETVLGGVTTVASN